MKIKDHLERIESGEQKLKREVVCKNWYETKKNIFLFYFLWAEGFANA